jgi:hypothetical protein
VTARAVPSGQCGRSMRSTVDAAARARYAEIGTSRGVHCSYPTTGPASRGAFYLATCPNLNCGTSQFPFQSSGATKRQNRPCPRPGFIRKPSNVRNWQRRPPILWSGLSWRNREDCGSRSPRPRRARRNGGRRPERRCHHHGPHSRRGPSWRREAAGWFCHFAIAFRPASVIRSQKTFMRRLPAIVS